MSDYPHQMSGGMRQRVMIAMALALSPRLPTADEPTTSLDGTIQAQSLELMDELLEKTGIALLRIPMTCGWWPKPPTPSWRCTRAAWWSWPPGPDVEIGTWSP